MIDPVLDHVGIVVTRLEPAMASLSEQLGFPFEMVFEGMLPVDIPGGGTGEVPLRIAASGAHPWLELIEAVPGTPWAPEQAGLHHLAYAVDDLGVESSRLAGHCPIEICDARRSDTEPTLFTYHTGGVFRVELLAPRDGARSRDDRKGKQ